MPAVSRVPANCAGPWACIDTDAISRNLSWLRQRMRASAPQREDTARTWAVVKADAYGHGLAHAVTALAHADGLCVSTLENVHELRVMGWNKPILLLSLWGLELQQLAAPGAGELHIVVDDERQLRMLETLSSPLPHVRAWIRYAGRLRTLGFATESYAPAFARLHALATAGRLAAAGHLHHYAAAEEPAQRSQEHQKFTALTAQLPGPRCSGNSASLCDADKNRHQAGDWRRCGLLLYGASALPGLTGPELGLLPAMTLQARLLSRRAVKAGQTVGYGDGFIATRDTNIGVVGIGYGHGLPRCLARRGGLLAGHDGRSVPLAGRIAMEFLTVDLGPDAPDQPGDIMTLWGRAAGGATLPIETVARHCDTIAAELFTGLTTRVQRIALHS